MTRVRPLTAIVVSQVTLFNRHANGALQTSKGFTFRSAGCPHVYERTMCCAPLVCSHIHLYPYPSLSVQCMQAGSGFGSVFETEAEYCHGDDNRPAQSTRINMLNPSPDALLIQPNIPTF